MAQVTIRDMIFVRNLERRLGRRLTDIEIEDDDPDGLEVRFPDGHREFVRIPILVFPDDLLSDPAVGIFECQKDQDKIEENEDEGDEEGY